MKRDPGIFREILIRCEEHPHGNAPDEIYIEGISREVVLFHVHLLGQAGYMQVASFSSSSTNSPQAIPLSLTNSGYEFLDTIRDEEVWKNTKSIIAKTGGWTLGVIASVATEIITRKAMEAIGT